MQNITGRRIRQLRTARKPRMTQADLASALQLKGFDIDRAGVAKVEGGYRQVSDIELVAIAEALGVAPGDVLRDADHQSSRPPEWL
jgi:HTH-type transcriptional regulator, cell division transcriptional repressor